MTKHSHTVAEQVWLDAVASLGCILCDHLGYGNTPAVIHHLREGRGAAQRSPHFLTVPLCPEHHTGGTGYHTLRDSGFERMYRLSELDLLALTIQKLVERGLYTGHFLD